MNIEKLEQFIKALPLNSEDSFVKTLKSILAGPTPKESVSMIYKILESADQVCLTKSIIASDSFEKNTVLEALDSNNIKQYVVLDLNVRTGIHNLTWKGYTFTSRHVCSKHLNELLFYQNHDDNTKGTRILIIPPAPVIV